MSFETKTDNLGTRFVGLASASPSDNRALGLGGRTDEETTRTDRNSAAAPVELVVEDLAATVEGIVLAIPHEKAQSGDTLSWAIASGDTEDHFTVSNAGELRRANGETLVGPYTLVVTATSGSPLHRVQRFEIAVTVEA